MNISLYKYRQFNEYTNNIIINSSLYFSPIYKFNDPFDCRLSFRQKYTKNEIRNYFKKFKQREEIPKTLKELMKKYGANDKFVKFQQVQVGKFISAIGILSLSKKCDSILMWSHYSNNHTGLVFEFQPKYKSSAIWFPYQVRYKNSYTVLSYTTGSKKRKRELVELLTTKYSDWLYEEEYRSIRLKFQGEKLFNKHELISIIFGAKAAKQDIENMVNLCRANGFSHVVFKQARIIPGKYDLKIEELIQ